MIRTIEVDLGVRGIEFPNTGVGMVVAQPFVELTQVEPFRCAPASTQTQLGVIARTLEVSRARTHGAEKTHFTVFPEYCIPGLEGISAINAELAAPAWPTGTIVIGGVDGLDRQQYSELAQLPGTHIDIDINGPAQIQGNEWVNCSVTWIKFSDGSVERWVQPKITPAFDEVDTTCQSMFKGRSVFVFKARFENNLTNRFCTLVCFDWIGIDGDKRIWEWVAKYLGDQATSIGADSSLLTWVFVVQYNKQPSHATFLSQIELFFDQTIQPNVIRNNACLVMVNAAGKAQPGRVSQFGSSSVLHSSLAPFNKPKCSPTYGNGGVRQRGSNQLGQVKDALFREGGACIHSFLQRNPTSVVPGAAGRPLIALDRPHVHSLDGVVAPRVPGTIVPASVKWINDGLDDVSSLAVRHPEATLAPNAQMAHLESVTQLRVVEPTAVENAVSLACPTNLKKVPDDWDTFESQSVEHILHTLAVFGAANAVPTISGIEVHATINLGEKELDVIAVRAHSHEESASHIEQNPPASRRPIVVVSRDDDNIEWPRRFQSFLRTPSVNSDGEEEFKVTDPTSQIKYVGYWSILNAFRFAQTPDQLSGNLDAVLYD
jgi:hypothetical protein